MSDEWQKLESDKAAKVLQQINPRLAPVPFTNENTTIRVQRLPFYKYYALYELTDHAAVPAARKYALASASDVMVIDWTNHPIYTINEKAPIVLNESTVIPYVKFFFNYVRGRTNRFQFIEGVEDIRWQAEPPLERRKEIQEIVEPMVVVEHDREGTYHIEAFMIFKDAIFKTRIHVKNAGIISLSDEEPKFEELAILQDAV